MENLVERFFSELVRKTREDTNYFGCLAMTLELHKFERDYQDFSKPRIFVRDCDNLGLAQKFTLNEIYQNTIGGEVISRVDEFNSNYRRRVEETLDMIDEEEGMFKIALMAEIDCTEDYIYKVLREDSGLSKREIDGLPHLFRRTYDSDGVPESFMINQNSIQVENMGQGNYELRVKGLPIREEDVKDIDLERIINSLLNEGGTP